MLHQSELPTKEGGPSFFGKLLRRVDGCQVKLIFDDKSDAARVTVDDLYERTSERLHLYTEHEPVRGRLVLTPTSSYYKHNGIIVQLVGVVTTVVDGEQQVELLRQERCFEPATVQQPTPYAFDFAAPKPQESYRGINARVSYFVRAVVQRPVRNSTVREEVWVSCVDQARSAALPDASAHLSFFRETSFGPTSTSMDVGVGDVLHIEFRYTKNVLHLGECVRGEVTFKVADMDLHYGEVGVVRKEFLGPGLPTDLVETETLQKFEIMDGTPIVGEVVPIRLFLRAVPRLTPTYANVAGCFRVLYYLNLVLVTGDGKRYFKQQEITLYRRHGQERPVTLRPVETA